LQLKSTSEADSSDTLSIFYRGYLLRDPTVDFPLMKLKLRFLIRAETTVMFEVNFENLFAGDNT
jgi:hypothetical protein